MDLKYFLKAMLIKTKRKFRTFKLFSKSYVSLFLVVLLTVGSVTAWFTANTTGISINTDTLSMRGASGMRNDKDKKSLDEIVIENFTLEEASSVDGRNLYFPSSVFKKAADVTTSTTTKTVPTGTGNATKNITITSNVDEQTKNLIYRDATAGDKRQRYAYAEGSLKSAADKTNVWIRGYKVKVGDDVYEDYMQVGSGLNSQTVPPDCPVRIAIISDSGEDAKIIDPSAVVTEYAVDTNAVYYITQEGKPKTKRTNAEAFSSYYYGTGNPLFQLNAGDSKDIAVIAWLEGSHPNARNYEGKKLSIDITIETNVSDMGLIYFHDYTAGDDHSGVTKSNYRDAADNWTSSITEKKNGHWLTNDNAIIVMSYYDNLASTWKTAPMTYLPKGKKSDDGVVTAVDDYTYCAALPSYVTTEISFYRLAPLADYENSPKYILKGNIYNSWHTKATMPTLSSTASGWVSAFGLGNMLTSRTKGTTTYWHYFAVRGNGYGVVDSTANTRYSYWLSPCVGYWGSNEGTLVGQSG